MSELNPPSKSSASVSGAHLLAAIGPGLLMAGAAIGVSHLVQSTKAGAAYGFSLLWIVLLANVLKYPFFQYGHRYYAATGETLLEGYRKLGNGYLWVFLSLNIVTAIGSIAGVTFVTAALAEFLFGTQIGNTAWTVILLAVCFVMVVAGRYGFLEKFIKVMMLVLFLATMAAFSAAAWHGSVAPPDFQAPPLALAFLVGLIGWMPAPIELSVWNSLWMKAKETGSGRKVDMRSAMFDFNLGYVLTTLLALVFVSLGAFVMFGSGETLSDKSTVFSAQLISLYTTVLGEAWKPVIAAAAFTTMFSTTLTVFDVYPRSLAETCRLLFPKLKLQRTWHILWMVVGGVSAVIIVSVFLKQLGALIGLVTAIAFVSAPVFAFLNFRLLHSVHTPEKFRPRAPLKYFSLVGLICLTLFAGFYLFGLFL